MMSKYEKKILDILIDKYEKSKSFIGQNKVNQSFKIKVASLFPEYLDHSNYEVFKNVNEAIDVLVRKGFVNGKANAACVYTQVVLKINELKNIYGYLGRIPKNDKVKQLRNLLERYVNENEIMQHYCSEQLDRLIENRSVKFFNGDFNEYQNVLESIKALMKVEDELYIREFSMQVFKDSKTFEKIQKKVENLLFEYGDYPEKEQILGNFNIVKTPTYVNFKGDGKLKISGQIIDLSKLSSDIAISSKLLQDIEQIVVLGKGVITIENLTSFYVFEQPDFFVIYLGGFHNTVRREFIKRLHQQNPNIDYYHFGDIDAGGFYILEHLKRNTGVNFKPYKMDVETLKKYKRYTKKITENDRKRLSDLLNTQYSEVIEYMLENNCKLEQEAVNHL